MTANTIDRTSSASSHRWVERDIKEIVKSHFQSIWRDLTYREIANKTKVTDFGVSWLLFIKYMRWSPILSERLFHVFNKQPTLTNKYLSFDDFTNGWTTLYFGKTPERIHFIFRVFDYNNIGIIYRRDIRQWMKYLSLSTDCFTYKYVNIPGEKEEINFDDYFRIVTNNENDSVSYYNWIDYIHKNKPFNWSSLKEYEKWLVINNCMIQEKRRKNNNLRQRSNSNKIHIQNHFYNYYSYYKVINNDLQNGKWPWKTQKVNYMSRWQLKLNSLISNSGCSANISSIYNTYARAPPCLNNSTISWESSESNMNTRTSSHNKPHSTFATSIHRDKQKSTFCTKSNDNLTTSEKTNSSSIKKTMFNSERPTISEKPKDELMCGEVTTPETTRDNNRKNTQMIFDFDEVLMFNSDDDSDNNNSKTINEIEEYPIEYEGIIYKKNAKSLTMKKMYYKLYNNNWYFFPKENSPIHQGMHVLVDSYINTDYSPIYLNGVFYYPFSIRYSYHYNDKMYYTINEEEKEKWVNILTEVSWVKDINSVYELQEHVIGKGSYGIVKSAYHLITREWCAVKILYKNQMHYEDMIWLIKEIEYLKVLSTNKNVNHWYEFFESLDAYYLVIEYCDQGTLLNYLSASNFVIPESIVKEIIRDLVYTISYIHSNGIIHRDWKIENILLKTPPSNSQVQRQSQCQLFPYDIRIIDFGLSTFIFPTETKSEPYGTITYVAPEIWEKKPYNNKVDSWSWGIVTYLLLAGVLPFNHYNEHDNSAWTSAIINDEVNYELLKIRNISISAIDFVNCCLTKSQSLRKDWTFLLHHPWIHN